MSLSTLVLALTLILMGAVGLGWLGAAAWIIYAGQFAAGVLLLLSSSGVWSKSLPKVRKPFFKRKAKTEESTAA